jgi:hypothetical protein
MIAKAAAEPTRDATKPPGAPEAAGVTLPVSRGSG